MSVTTNIISEIRHQNQIYEFKDKEARRQIENIYNTVSTIQDINDADFVHETLSTNDNKEYIRKNGQWVENNAVNNFAINNSVLPIINGGTGATTTTDFWDSMGLNDLASEEDAPLGTTSYVRKNGEWVSEDVKKAKWGYISESITSQTDLWNYLQHLSTPNDLSDNTTLGELAWKNEISLSSENATNILPVSKGGTGVTTIVELADNIKPNLSLSTMAFIDDAPNNDNKEYVRKNGQWVENTGGSGGITEVNWGDIEGSLTLQLDLSTALDLKANSADLGQLAYKDNLSTELDLKVNVTDFNSFTATLGELAYKDSISTDYITNTLPLDKGGTGATTAVDARTNLGLGGMAITNDTASDGYIYTRRNGAWYKVGEDNAGFHNSIYRGASLGSELNDAQKTAIGNGTFNNLFIGDYWTIGGVNYRIAAFDYWLNTGQNSSTYVTTHHVVIVPDTNLATGQLNSTNTTANGYYSSEYYTGDNSNTLKATVQSIINTAFGSDHILSHKILLPNATSSATSGYYYESGGSWYDSTIELMCERMVYGTNIFHVTVSNGVNVPYLYSVDKTQLSLFALNPSLITNNTIWWLRDVVSSAHFAGVSNNGDCGHSGASGSFGIRPAFGIIA